MIGNEKSSPVLKTPYKICIVVKDCSVTSHSRSQEQNISQKVSITSGAPNENKVQNHLNIALLNVF